MGVFHFNGFFFHVSFRYLSNTVKNVPVIEGKATLLNFTLEKPGEMLLLDPSEQPIVTNEDLRTLGLPTSKYPIQTLEFRHHSYNEMEMLLQLFSAVHPNITDLNSAGQSVQGRNLYVMEISTNPGVDQQGAVANSQIFILYMCVHYGSKVRNNFLNPYALFFCI